MDLNLKIEGATPPRVMSLAFLLAFACTEKSVLVIEGKCIASLQEDPAEDSLCLACFYCATTLQGLELDLRFCDGKLDCFFCWTASPYLSGRDSPKRGRRHISSDLYLFPGAGLLFQPWAAEILQKGALQLDLNVASISASTSFFLWRRESALLLCKMIPLKIVYACLACFFCATTMQGLELDLRFCDGKLDCFFCWSASPYLPLDPFSSRERPRSSKKAAAAASGKSFTFFQVLDPFSSRERPRSFKKGRRNLTSM